MAADAPPTTHAALEVTVIGAKSDKGLIRLAICAPNTGFPDCGKNAVRSGTMAISKGVATFRFADIPPGTYAIGVFHDANSNGKLDTFMGIPREGYGFSRNPPFRPRAPRFNEVEVSVHDVSAQSITLRYLM